MPSSKIKVTCPICNTIKMTRKSDYQRSERRHGCWKCKSCRIRSLHEANSKPIGTKRFHDQRQRIIVKTEGGWKDEHRFVMEKFLGRQLDKDEVVHHIDQNPFNNNIENLELMLNGSHSKLHHIGLKRSDKTRDNISNALKGRNPRPIKLTEKEVKEIRSRYGLGDCSYGTLAEMYNVSKGMVRNIVKHWSWRSV